MEVNIQILRDGVVPPSYQTLGAAGFDIAAAADIQLLPKQTNVIPTGFAIDLPYGFELQIRPRSGISLHTPIRIANSPGTIDSDYRGEVGVICTNTSDSSITIHKGERIAQGVVTQYDRVFWKVTSELTETARGAGGFGHTGTN